MTIKEIYEQAKAANELDLKEIDFVYREKIAKDFESSYLWIQKVSEGKENKELQLMVQRYQTMLVDYKKLLDHCQDLKTRLFQAEVISESLKGHERVNKIISKSIEKLIEENKQLKL